MTSFVRRAGRFMASLIQALNTQTFTPIASITDPNVANEERDNIDRTVKIMEDMQRVEVQRDEDGHVVAMRLTADGEQFRNFYFGGRE